MGAIKVVVCQNLKIAGVLTRRHRLSLLLLLGFVSDPDEHLKMGEFYTCRQESRQYGAQSSGFFTWSQESKIMTSSVARSSWVISPGTSSICEEEKDVVKMY